MRGLSTDRGRLVHAFTVHVSATESFRVRLYLGLDDTKENRRSERIKEIRDLVVTRNYSELARLYPEYKQLARFAIAVTTPDASTVREVTVRFLDHQRQSVSPRTVEGLERIFRNHILPEIGDMAIKVVSPSDVIRTCAKATERARASKPGDYGPLARHVRRNLSELFNFASRERGRDGRFLVESNPVNLTKPPKAARPDVNPLSQSEVRRVISACHPGWERRFMTVMFETAMRPHEGFGLKVGDLDFDGRTIHVQRGWSDGHEIGVKTPRSNRLIRMSDACYEALRAQRDEVQMRNQGWLWPANEHSTKPFEPNTFSGGRWPKITQRAGIKHRRLYQTRHTWAVQQLQQGADWMWMADRMGHSSLHTLQNDYWRWRPSNSPSPSKNSTINRDM